MQRLAIWLYRAIGAAVAIALMEYLANFAEEPVSRVPFVTSIVLTLALPDSEAARPYAVIVGHVLSTMAGFVAMWTLGVGVAASAVGVGLATLLMMAARATHPPAGIDGFLVPTMALTPLWVLKPVFLGAVLIALFARLWAAGERSWLAGRQT